MSAVSDFAVTPSADPDKPGAAIVFAYDRARVRRFRRRFTQARWNEGGWWWLPGVTAAQRLDRWIAEEQDLLDRHGNARGRDAYDFEPLESRYLETSAEELVVRTRFSPAVVRELRAVPFAAWDADGKVWRIPWRGYQELKRRWPAIEAAAAAAEPEARAARPPPPRPDAMTLRRHADRRKARYPVPGADLPPEGRPVATMAGVVIFEDFGAMLTDVEAEAYPFIADAADHVWGSYRIPQFRELRRVAPDPQPDRSRGWWTPTDDELDHARDMLGRRIRRVTASPSATTRSR